MLSQASAPSEPLLRHSIQSTCNPEVEGHDLTLPLVVGLTRVSGQPIGISARLASMGLSGAERRIDEVFGAPPQFGHEVLRASA